MALETLLVVFGIILAVGLAAGLLHGGTSARGEDAGLGKRGDDGRMSS